MAVVIMIAGLLAAVLGTTLAILMGLHLEHALLVYGFFGICGGILASSPMLRTFGRHTHNQNRTTG